MTDTAADLLRYAAECDAKAKDLEDRYGTGIRPQWVGEELTLLHHRAERARAKAERLVPTALTDTAE